MASPVDASPTSSRLASCDFDMTGAPPLHPQFNDDTDDADSVYGEDSLPRDETKTLSTFVTEYRYEFGRRYHAFRDGAYWVCGGSDATWIPPLTSCKGPNDEAANEQQNLAHNMYLLTLDGQLHLAPLDHPQVRFLSDMHGTTSKPVRKSSM